MADDSMTSRRLYPVCFCSAMLELSASEHATAQRETVPTKRGTEKKKSKERKN